MGCLFFKEQSEPNQYTRPMKLQQSSKKDKNINDHYNIQKSIQLVESNYIKEQNVQEQVGEIQKQYLLNDIKNDIKYASSESDYEEPFVKQINQIVSSYEDKMSIEEEEKQNIQQEQQDYSRKNIDFRISRQKSYNIAQGGVQKKQQPSQLTHSIAMPYNDNLSQDDILIKVSENLIMKIQNQVKIPVDLKLQQKKDTYWKNQSRDYPFQKLLKHYDSNSHTIQLYMEDIFENIPSLSSFIEKLTDLTSKQTYDPSYLKGWYNETILKSKQKQQHQVYKFQNVLTYYHVRKSEQYIKFEKQMIRIPPRYLNIYSYIIKKQYGKELDFEYYIIQRSENEQEKDNNCNTQVQPNTSYLKSLFQNQLNPDQEDYIKGNLILEAWIISPVIKKQQKYHIKFVKQFQAKGLNPKKCNILHYEDVLKMLINVKYNFQSEYNT